MATPAQRHVVLDSEQRTLVWRKNDGWVKSKRCTFCNTMCHIDDVGLWCYGGDYSSQHTWYCSIQCAHHRSWLYLRSLLSKSSASGRP